VKWMQDQCIDVSVAVAVAAALAVAVAAYSATGGQALCCKTLK